MTTPARNLHFTGVTLRDTDRTLAIDLDSDGSHVAIARGSDAASAKLLVFRADGTLVEGWGEDGMLGRAVCFAPGPGGRPAIYSVLETSEGRLFTRRDHPGGGGVKQLACYRRISYASTLTRSNAGGMLAVGGNFLELWDLEHDKRVADIPPRDQTSQLRAAFAPGDRSIIVYGHIDGFVVELALPGLEELRRWPAPGRQPRQVVVSPDGELLLVVADGQVGVFLYHLTSRERVLSVLFDENITVGRYAFASPSRILRIVGTRVAAIDLDKVAFVSGPTLDGTQEVAIAVARDAPRMALAWSDADARTGSFAIDD